MRKVHPAMTDQPIPAPQIQPQPLPTRVEVNLVGVQQPGQPSQHLLRWDITTPAGTAVFFSDKQFSQQLAKILMGFLQQWPAGLVVPSVDLGAVAEELRRPNSTRH